MGWGRRIKDEGGSRKEEESAAIGAPSTSYPWSFILHPSSFFLSQWGRVDRLGKSFIMIMLSISYITKNIVTVK